MEKAGQRVHVDEERIQSAQRSTPPSQAPELASARQVELAGLQRTIGNRATVALLSERRVARAPNDVVNDPVRSRLFGSGNVSLEELLGVLDSGTEGDKARINGLPPESPVLRGILHGPLQQSWVLAKEELAYKKTGVRNVLMSRLIEYRRWHHDMILKKTKARVRELTGADDLTWGAEGSTSLTSDIDVNLKGSQTEVAVAQFNQMFRLDGWDHEAGVVYDVNVYAKDFMFSPKGFGAEGPSGAVTLVKKEGERTKTQQGGVSTPEAYADDQRDQQAWALVKARIHMPWAQWQSYLTATNVPEKVAALASQRYDKYMLELKGQMQKTAKAKAPADKCKDLGPGTARIEATAEGILGDDSSALGVESLKMESSNRVYEDKLRAIKKQRATLKAAIDTANAAPADVAREKRVEDLLTQLRSVVSEAALWSNEAYVTDAAVNHAVVGLQIGSTISQTVDELMIAVTENMADALKESRRHDSHAWEAAAKSGKYVWRMTDAAKNAGLSKAVPGLDRLYRAAFELAPVIKSGSSDKLPGGKVALHLHTGAKDADKVEGILRDLGVWVEGDDKATVAAWQGLIVKIATESQKAAATLFTTTERGYAAAPVTAQESRGEGTAKTRHAVFNTA